MYTPEIENLAKVILEYKRDLIYNVYVSKGHFIINPEISDPIVRESLLTFVNSIMDFTPNISVANDNLCAHINMLYVYKTLEAELEALGL